MDVTEPAYRDPVRLGIEAGMDALAWALAVPSAYGVEDELEAYGKLHAAWLSLPKCPCCGDDDHDGIFPLVLVTTAREAEAWPFRPEKTCPKCRNWARSAAMKAVA